MISDYSKALNLVISYPKQGKNDLAIIRSYIENSHYYKSLIDKNKYSKEDLNFISNYIKNVIKYDVNLRDSDYSKNFIIRKFLNCEINSLELIDAITIILSNDITILNLDKNDLILNYNSYLNNHLTGSLKDKYLYYFIKNIATDIDIVNFYLSCKYDNSLKKLLDNNIMNIIENPFLKFKNGYLLDINGYCIVNYIKNEYSFLVKNFLVFTNIYKAAKRNNYAEPYNSQIISLLKFNKDKQDDNCKNTISYDSAISKLSSHYSSNELDKNLLKNIIECIIYNYMSIAGVKINNIYFFDDFDNNVYGKCDYVNKNIYINNDLIEQFFSSDNVLDRNQILITLFHEMTHMRQYKCIEDGSLNINYYNMIKEMLIIEHNGSFYDNNYYKLINELDANTSSYKMTTKFLEKINVEEAIEFQTAILNHYTAIINSSSAPDMGLVNINVQDIIGLIIKNDKNVLRTYPVLEIEYNLDGSKKSLLESFIFVDKNSFNDLGFYFIMLEKMWQENISNNFEINSVLNNKFKNQELEDFVFKLSNKKYNSIDSIYYFDEGYTTFENKRGKLC